MNRLTILFCSLLFGLLATASAVADTTTFNFTGDCLDCSNPQGQLMLEDYPFGTALNLNPAELGSFTYSSNLANVSVTQSNLLSLYGSLDNTPGSYMLALVFSDSGQDYVFAADPAGDWCYGLLGTCAEGAGVIGGVIGIDHGTNGVFSPAIAATTPEPSSLLMLFTGAIGGIGTLRRKLIA